MLCVYNLVVNIVSSSIIVLHGSIAPSARLHLLKALFGSICFRIVRTYCIILTFNNKIRMAKLMKLYESNSILYETYLCVHTATDEMS